MNRMKPWILTAAVAALALSFMTVALAQPSPPSAFTGTVTSADGDVATGLSVEAFVGDTLCNNQPAETYSRSGVTRYFVTVHNSSTRDGCDGDIRFEIGGQAATQTAQHGGSGPVTLNLTLAPEGPDTVTISVAVWRRNVDPVGALAISTLAPGQRWQTSDWPLDMSDVSSSGRWSRSEITQVDVELANGSTVTIDVAVWERRVSPVGALAVSTRAPGSSWRTSDWPLDMSDVSSSGRWNRSEIVEVEVELE
ncbi:MAG: hypothetical protein OXS47_12700 [Chloroflexota bacterium]|nr:hypothetical protein [Chloroflexota bacterium]